MSAEKEWREIEIPFDLSPKQGMLCYTENQAARKEGKAGYSDDLYFTQVPVSMVVALKSRDVFFGYAPQKSPTELVEVQIYVKAKCEGCGAINTYPWGYFKEEKP